jgi:serine-type D-Ala-D-Ala carboxypeptidase (penicillin-binding protein 5/6)
VRRLLATTALVFSAVLTAPIGWAAPDVQPAGAVIAPPDGPAQAWLVADLDTGQVLGSRDPNGSHAPASTIKPLLAMVVLDHLNPNSFARANQSHTQVECSCVGLVPGQAYTTTQLLAALLMVSGNDAANMLADMLGGQRVAVAAMNAKAQALGARISHDSLPSVIFFTGWLTTTTT